MIRNTRKSDLEDLTLPENDGEETSTLTSDLPSRGRRTASINSPRRSRRFTKKLVPPLIIILVGVLGFLISYFNKPKSSGNTNQNFDNLVDTNTNPTTPDTTQTQPQPQYESKEFATVNSKDTGYVNVRAQASKTSTLLGKLNDGQKAEVLTEQTGWVQVKLDTPLNGKDSGWISSQYVATSTEQVQVNQ